MLFRQQLWRSRRWHLLARYMVIYPQGHAGFRVGYTRGNTRSWATFHDAAFLSRYWVVRYTPTFGSSRCWSIYRWRRVVSEVQAARSCWWWKNGESNRLVNSRYKITILYNSFQDMISTVL
jgi:hypothetical protein